VRGYHTELITALCHVTSGNLSLNQQWGPFNPAYGPTDAWGFTHEKLNPGQKEKVCAAKPISLFFFFFFFWGLAVRRNHDSTNTKM